jgi:hypothetical protein
MLIKCKTLAFYRLTPALFMDPKGLHSLGQFGPPQGCVLWLALETS